MIFNARFRSLAVTEAGSGFSFVDLSVLFFIEIDGRRWASSFLELLSPNLQ
jgi:hypothetical protein